MSACRSCRAEIWWARTESGKRIPLDPEPVPDGNVVVVQDSPPVVRVLAAADLPLHIVPTYKSHFATCPHADTHRTPKET